MVQVKYTEETLRELLSQKLQEVRAYATIAVTAFTVYMAISGVLLKFSLDGTQPGNDRHVLIAAGVMTSAVYLSVCFSYCHVRKSLVRDITHLNLQLGAPLISTQVIGLTYIALSSGTFTALALLGWLYLWFSSSE